MTRRSRPDQSLAAPRDRRPKVGATVDDGPCSCRSRPFPFVEAREHLGGFTVVDVGDLDAALDWGGRLAVATGLPIEVRPFRYS